MKVRFIHGDIEKLPFHFQKITDYSFTINDILYDFSAQELIQEYDETLFRSVEFKNNELFIEIRVPCGILLGIPWGADYCEHDEVSNLKGFADEKISEISNTCRDIICFGQDIQLSFGTEHFSYKDEDQRNLNSLFLSATSMSKNGIDIECLPYHANGKECKLFKPSDIINIYYSMQAHITYHTTYCNLLSLEIRKMNFSEIINVHYGVELNDLHKEKLNDIVNTAVDIIKGVVQ